MPKAYGCGEVESKKREIPHANTNQKKTGRAILRIGKTDFETKKKKKKSITKEKKFFLMKESVQRNI